MVRPPAPPPEMADDFEIPADLTTCDREPIHIPGSIQPHGAVLALDESGTIRCTSANIAATLGAPPQALLGTSVADLLPPEGAYELARRGAQLRGDLRLCFPLRAAGRRFDAALHRSGAFTLLELEPAASRARDELDHDAFLRALAEFQRATSLSALAQTATEVLRELTGYDRVMLYRFDAARNGEILGEARREDLESFLGLRYPATDIPQQAYALYLRSRLRMIVDVDYTPVPLIPRVDATSERPLDLGISWLRSVSPVHIEYLKNMGVRATLVLSLVWQGRLWGLVACHHYSPRLLPQGERQRCEALAQALANQIAAVEQGEQLRAREEMQAAQRRLLYAAATCPPDQLSTALGNLGASLLAVVRAQGAVIWQDGPSVRAGEVPSRSALRELVAWLDGQHLREPLALDSLAAALPWAAELRSVAAGLLALPLSERGGQYAMWFRPELVETVTWGGKPDKDIRVEPDGVRLSPRRSFEQWKQIVHLRAEPWGPLELESAAAMQRLGDIAMRKRLEEDLQHAQQLEALARLAGGVAHDFERLLTGVLDCVDIAERHLPVGHPARAPVLEIGRSARGGAEITRRLLQLRGEGQGESEPADLEATLRFAEGPLRRLLGEGVDLRLELGGLEGRVACTEGQLDQILHILVRNAGQALAGRGALTISTLERRGARGRVARLVVRDDGVGMDAYTRSRAFEPYFTTRPAGEGAGLGLATVRGLVTRAGGTVALESAEGVGTTFTLDLPLVDRV